MKKSDPSISAHWYENSDFFYELGTRTYLTKKQNFEKFRLSNSNEYRFAPKLILGEKYLTCVFISDKVIDGISISEFRIVRWSNVND